MSPPPPPLLPPLPRHRRNNMSAKDGHVLLVMSTRGGGKVRHGASPRCLRGHLVSKWNLNTAAINVPVNKLAATSRRWCRWRRQGQAKFMRRDKLKYLCRAEWVLGSRAGAEGARSRKQTNYTQLELGRAGGGGGSSREPRRKQHTSSLSRFLPGRRVVVFGRDAQAVRVQIPPPP